MCYVLKFLNLVQKNIHAFLRNRGVFAGTFFLRGTLVVRGCWLFSEKTSFYCDHI